MARAKTPVFTGFTPSWGLVMPSLKLIYQHLDQLIYISILPTLVTALGDLLLSTISGKNAWHHLTDRQVLGLAFLGVGVVWTLINLGPSYILRLQASKGQPLSIGDYYRRGFRYFWRLVGLYAGLILVIGAGFILVVVPGMILLYLYIERYYLTAYYMVDEDLPIRQAMQRSRQETESAKPFIWGIVGVQLAFAVLTFLITVSLAEPGVILGLAVSFSCLFLNVLRYREVRALIATDKK